MADRLQPDVILLDICMPRGTINGLEVLRGILESNSEAKVLMLTAYLRDLWVDRSFRAGAKGYLLKEASTQDLFAAIRTVHQGRVWMPEEVKEAYIRWQRVREQGRELTNREVEVLRLMARGLSNEEIAARLSISERTVKDHITHILDKLEVNRRTEAIRWGYAIGYIVPEEDTAGEGLWHLY
jgi:DNA-binding NarL/FixJ family response regulator